MTKIEYTENNSGGYWRLTEEMWGDLRAAGWTDHEWSQHGLEKTGFLSLNYGIAEWEAVTGLDAADEGCPCCGLPHNFTFTDAEGNREYF